MKRDAFNFFNENSDVISENLTDYAEVFPLIWFSSG